MWRKPLSVQDIFQKGGYYFMTATTPISNDSFGLLKCALIRTIIIRQAEARLDSLYTPYARTKSKSLKYILIYIVC